MIHIVKFVNERSVPVEIIVEPSAEEIELAPGETVSFEISQNQYERFTWPFFYRIP